MMPTMFTKKDAEWVKSNRKELTENRTVPITLLGKSETGRHPVTGEPIEETVEEKTKAIVTEQTSAFKTDISLDGGIMVEKGDIWVVIDLDDMQMGKDEATDLIYAETKYKVLSADAQGLGKLNRVIIVGRKVS